MYWEVLLPGNNHGTLDTSITIKADTWLAALRDGLAKHQLATHALSNLSCDVKPNKTIYVTDIVSQREYILRPISPAHNPSNSTASPANPFTGTLPQTPNYHNNSQKKNVTMKTEDLNRTVDIKKPQNTNSNLPNTSERQNTDGLSAAADETQSAEPTEAAPQYEVFFSRDETSVGDRPIHYVERLICVEPGTAKEAAGQLALDQFDTIKKRNADNRAKLFVSVQVFDHTFKNQAKRPAVAALSWKQWNPNNTQLQFPLSGDESIRLSWVSQPQKKKLENPKSEKSKKGRNLPVDETIVQVFEEMQEIYKEQDHNKAALFVLNLAAEHIKCEAGSVMLITPGCYELYVAAALGPKADDILGKHISFTKGIVGFSANTGSVINVSDPYTDPRFHMEFDDTLNFITKNIVCAPIQFEGKITGAIELINSPKENGFSQEEANVLSYIAGAAGEYMDTSLPSREADFSNQEIADLIKRASKPAPPIKIDKPRRTQKTPSGTNRKKATRSNEKRDTLANPSMKQKKRKKKTS